MLQHICLWHRSAYCSAQCTLHCRLHSARTPSQFYTQMTLSLCQLVTYLHKNIQCLQLFKTNILLGSMSNSTRQISRNRIGSKSKAKLSQNPITFKTFKTFNPLLEQERKEYLYIFTLSRNQFVFRNRIYTRRI